MFTMGRNKIRVSKRHPMGQGAKSLRSRSAWKEEMKLREAYRTIYLMWIRTTENIVSFIWNLWINMHNRKVILVSKFSYNTPALWENWIAEKCLVEGNVYLLKVLKNENAKSHFKMLNLFTCPFLNLCFNEIEFILVAISAPKALSLHRL